MGCCGLETRKGDYVPLGDVLTDDNAQNRKLQFFKFLDAFPAVSSSQVEFLIECEDIITEPLSSVFMPFKAFMIGSQVCLKLLETIKSSQSPPWMSSTIENSLLRNIQTAQTDLVVWSSCLALRLWADSSPDKLEQIVKRIYGKDDGMLFVAGKIKMVLLTKRINNPLVQVNELFPAIKSIKDDSILSRYLKDLTTFVNLSEYSPEFENLSLENITLSVSPSSDKAARLQAIMKNIDKLRYLLDLKCLYKTKFKPVPKDQLKELLNLPNLPSHQLARMLSNNNPAPSPVTFPGYDLASSVASVATIEFLKRTAKVPANCLNNFLQSDIPFSKLLDNARSDKRDLVHFSVELLFALFFPGSSACCDEASDALELSVSLLDDPVERIRINSLCIISHLYDATDLSMNREIGNCVRKVCGVVETTKDAEHVVDILGYLRHLVLKLNSNLRNAFSQQLKNINLEQVLEWTDKTVLNRKEYSELKHFFKGMIK